MRAATEGSLPLVMPQGNIVEVLGREVRQGSPGELMVESTPSRQRRPPCKTNKEESDEAADAAALTYYLVLSRLVEQEFEEVGLVRVGQMAACCRYLWVRYVSCSAVLATAVRCMCAAVAWGSSVWVRSKV